MGVDYVKDEQKIDRKQKLNLLQKVNFDVKLNYLLGKYSKKLLIRNIL